MSTVRGSIDVAVPSGVAYEEFCHLENFPHFMAAVSDVTPLSPNTAHMVMELAGSLTEFDACLIADQPSETLSWESMNGPQLSETVRLQRLSEGTTRVIAELHCETDAQELLSRRLKADLAGFKLYIERVALRSANATLAGGPTTAVPNPNIMQGRVRSATGNELTMRAMPSGGNLGPMQRPLARPPSHSSPTDSPANSPGGIAGDNPGCAADDSGA